MFAVTIDTALFTQLDTRTWVILGGLAALWGSKLLPGGLLNKLRSWFQRGILDDEPLLIHPPDVVDDMPLLIHQMRLCVCDEEPAVRDGCNRHLDEIETLIGGTEIDPNE